MIQIVYCIKEAEWIPRPIFEDISEILNTGFLNENIKNFIEYKEYNTPIFGSFGFVSRNKGLDNLVKIINEQYDKAIIKLILPFDQFTPTEQNFMVLIFYQSQKHIVYIAVVNYIV